MSAKLTDAAGAARVAALVAPALARLAEKKKAAARPEATAPEVRDATATPRRSAS